MSSVTLIRLSGLAAMLAGLLRTIASFIPYNSSTGHELFYLVIDMLILLGLLGIYFCQHERVGVSGLLGFLSALIGTAIITGPDGSLGGVEIYVVGSMMISLGLTVLAIGTWRAQVLPRTVPLLWLLSTLVGIGGFVAGGLAVTFLIAGVAFGLSFIIAGMRIWSGSANR